MMPMVYQSPAQTYFYQKDMIGDLSLSWVTGLAATWLPSPAATSCDPPPGLPGCVVLVKYPSEIPRPDTADGGEILHHQKDFFETPKARQNRGINHLSTGDSDFATIHRRFAFLWHLRDVCPMVNYQFAIENGHL